MKNIRIIKENIDVSGILKQLKSYPEDWGNVGRMKGTDRQDPHKTHRDPTIPGRAKITCRPLCFSSYTHW